MPTITITGTQVGEAISIPGQAIPLLASSVAPIGALFTAGSITISGVVTGTIPGTLALITTATGASIRQFTLPISSGGAQVVTQTLTSSQLQLYTEGGRYTASSMLAYSASNSPITSLSVTITLTYTEPTITTPSVTTPGVLPSGSTTTSEPYRFTYTQSPNGSVFPTTGYTVTIEITRLGIRDGSVNGTANLYLHQFGTVFTNPFNIGGDNAYFQTVTFVEGRASVTVSIDALATGPTIPGSVSISQGICYFAIPTTTMSGKVILTSASGTFYLSTGFGLPPAPVVGASQLVFTSNPPSDANIGETFPVAVTAQTVTGTTVTGFTGTIFLVIQRADGTRYDTTKVTGTKSSTFVSGVATFSNIGFTEPGRYRFKVGYSISPPVTDAISSPITILGEPVAGDIVGLRLNLAEDGTTWVGTTGYPTVSANPAISAGDKAIIDGDFNVTNNKTIHGIRFIPQYAFRVSRIDLKYKVSTLTGVPYIRILYSTDTTNGTNGTWTLLTSHRIDTTDVSNKSFVFTTSTLYKGLWVTLDQGSGSPSMNWYGMHVFGGYAGAPISILNINAVSVDNEGILSIPYPATPIAAAGTHNRDFLVRNNSNSLIYLGVQVGPARYGGDTGVEPFVSVYDTNDNPVSPAFVLQPHEARALRLKWLSTATPTYDGEHLLRVTMRSGDATSSEALLLGGQTAYNGYRINTIDNVNAISTGTGGYVFTGVSLIPFSDVEYVNGSRKAWYVQYRDTATNETYVGYIQNGAVLYTVTLTSPADKTAWTRILSVSQSEAWLTHNTDLVVYKETTLSASASMTESAWKTAHAFFTLPSQTTGPKLMRHGNSGHVWIANGHAADIKIYEYDRNGSLWATIDTSTVANGLNGLTIETFCYDPAADEIYVVTRNTGSGRYIARYDASDGSFIAKVANSDEGTVRTQGIGVVAGYVYVLYNTRYVWKYDSGTLANGSRVYDYTITAYTPDEKATWEVRY